MKRHGNHDRISATDARREQAAEWTRELGQMRELEAANGLRHGAVKTVKALRAFGHATRLERIQRQAAKRTKCFARGDHRVASAAARRKYQLSQGCEKTHVKKSIGSAPRKVA